MSKKKKKSVAQEVETLIHGTCGKPVPDAVGSEGQLFCDLAPGHDGPCESLPEGK